MEPVQGQIQNPSRSVVPQPGFEALLAGLAQGGKPIGEIAQASPILGGLATQGASVDMLSPELIAQLSAMLRAQVGGEGARAPEGLPAL